MDPYYIDWINLFIRWFHVIAGVAWIGASFYFVWLDNSLQDPPDWKKEKGIKGDLWAIHGGGFYEVAKYRLAPEKMPATLHWFKWEAYTTWLTGFMLLSLMYYFGAETYLIDKSVMELSQWQAIGIGVGLLVAGWALYDGLCRSPLSRNGYVFGSLLLGLAILASWGLTQVFSARGAYIHVGALMGTLMAGNVLMIIIPSQKALVNAVKAGAAPDPRLGENAKLRSTHNNYMTLPLIFIMISNHYPMTYGHEWNWAILSALVVITAFARHYFNLKHRGVKQPAILVIAMVMFIGLAVIVKSTGKADSADAEQAADTADKVGFMQAAAIIHNRCASCHAAKPTQAGFAEAPAGVLLDTTSGVMRHLQQIQQVAVDSNYMPLGNLTGMTDEERQQLGAWIKQGGGTE
ncbi:hypothetical protein EUZ85_27790 [Hahella sp. KA22]|uniref:urate hydroxylase PuuD n=1 Tax=Hahella sp. KA22 TaxID=1628392 RepID=UPI000FDE8252|nr:urate hydroxylase PuuD [Hahella sp. KA22]AZZ94318.1 hypothetical protein ENC22_25205 [Hahella sp. KA22]QAY57692.1 hypothetical protein EUZ85_27790 [Hahella sp. KA22]